MRKNLLALMAVGLALSTMPAEAGIFGRRVVIRQRPVVVRQRAAVVVPRAAVVAPAVVVPSHAPAAILIAPPH